jgi:hypothetical protein
MQSRFSDFQSLIQKYWLLLIRFVQRFGYMVLILFAAAIIGWGVASGVSDYTKGGWEIHVIQSGLGIDVHFHHWYYGIPLYLLAFALIERMARTSIFIFGLGQSLAAHSFINERGIPSILESGSVLPVPAEVYFPVSTLLAILYALFIIRRGEWLARAKEREEIAMSYLCTPQDTPEVILRIDEWAGMYFKQRRSEFDDDTKTLYGSWSLVDNTTRSEWQLHYIISPFDQMLSLLSLRIEHVPVQGRAGQLENWMRGLHVALQPLAAPAIAGPASIPAAHGAQPH